MFTLRLLYRDEWLQREENRHRAMLLASVLPKEIMVWIDD